MDVENKTQTLTHPVLAVWVAPCAWLFLRSDTAGCSGGSAASAAAGVLLRDLSEVLHVLFSLRPLQLQAPHLLLQRAQRSDHCCQTHKHA